MHASSLTRRRTTITALLVAAVTVLSGCGRSASGATAARVGDERISGDSIAAAVDRGIAGAPTLDRAVLTREHLTTLVRLELLRDLAKERNFPVSEADIAKSWTEFEKQNGDRAGLEKAAGSSGVAPADLPAAVEMTTYLQVLSERFGSSSPVTDAELDEFRTANAERLADQAQASHILVKDEALAQKLLAEIKGGADFAALAKQHNQDATKDKGGDLGVAPRGRYVPEFEAALWAAKEGDVVGPVKTQFGYHLIKVVEIQRFEDIKEQVRTAAATSIGNTRVLDALKGSAVNVNSRYGRWDPERIAVVTDSASEDPSAPKGSVVDGTGFATSPAAQSPAQ